MTSLEVRMSFVDVCKTYDLNYDLTTNLSIIYLLLEICFYHASQEIEIIFKKLSTKYC